MVQTLDEISDLVCKMADPAELLVSVLKDAQMREAAGEATWLLQEKIASLNQDPVLEQATRWAHERQNEMSAEEKAVCEQLLIEFEHQGSLLDESSKQKLSLLQADLFEASEVFRSAEHDAKDDRKICLNFKQFENWPPALRNHVSRDPSNGQYFVHANDSYVTDFIISFSEDETLRKAASWNDRKSALKATDRLLHARHRLATHLGFPSYSHYYSWHRALKTPEQILGVLDSLHSKLKPKIAQEISLLEKAKLAHTKHESSINHWDIAFYQGHVLQESQQLDRRVVSAISGTLNAAQHQKSSKSYVSSTMEEYFTLENVLKGAQALFSNLFQVRLEFVSGVEQEVWHPLVMHVDFIDERTAQKRGTAYFDLVSRPDKPGSANYPLRLRSRLASPAVAMLTHIPVQSHLKNTLSINYQTTASQLIGGKSPVLVPYESLRTFFHELGHLTQAMLCENQYQHFSGTRGLMDHIETPSQVLERFASDYRFVSLFGKHFQTGETIPEEAFLSHVARRGIFAGLRTERQILLAALDQTLHSTAFHSSADVLQSVNAKYATIPNPECDMYHAGFQHLLGYGSVYYSYLFCGIQASHLYQSLFSNDPLNPEAGKLYREQFLALGGLCDPVSACERLTGRVATPDSFVKDICEGHL